MPCTEPSRPAAPAARFRRRPSAHRARGVGGWALRMLNPVSARADAPPSTDGSHPTTPAGRHWTVTHPPFGRLPVCGPGRCAAALRGGLCGGARLERNEVDRQAPPDPGLCYEGGGGLGDTGERTGTKLTDRSQEGAVGCRPGKPGTRLSRKVMVLTGNAQ